MSHISIPQPVLCWTCHYVWIHCYYCRLCSGTHGLLLAGCDSATLLLLCLGNNVLQYLLTRDLSQFVRQSLIQVCTALLTLLYCCCCCCCLYTYLLSDVQLVARLTKQGWFDTEDGTYVFRDILRRAKDFLRVCTQSVYTRAWRAYTRAWRAYTYVVLCTYV